MRARSWGVATVLTLAACLPGVGTAAADPDALWHVVHDQCVADLSIDRDPAPCARVDLDGGEAHGYAILKDTDGDRQYLVIPTARITGIESPALLEPGATNYFAAAWRARAFVEQRAGGTIPRSWLSLAVNSAVSRSQNQLHVHVDCLRADVHKALSAYADRIGTAWAAFPVPLAGHTYLAVAVGGEELTVNPFALLADGITDGADMGLHTLVVTGADDVGGQPGFVLLADRADGETGDFAGGEQLQDHDSCPPPMPPVAGTAK